MSEGPAYCPFYCEENLWHLAADPEVGEGTRHVLLISNAEHKVALWQQRAGAEDQGGLVVWDYHVVLVVGTAVWDLDSELGAPAPAPRYFAETFRPVPERFAPRFRVMDASDYREAFASDRRHMRGPDGSFVQPPPPWDPIGMSRIGSAKALTLDALRDPSNEEPGEVVDLPGLIRLLGLSP